MNITNGANKTINERLYCAKGKLKITARGYWYTGGGIKGSFGYYPHLKDHNNYPVYPDTLLKGNLRTAALWLNNLENNKENSKKENWINELFGKEGNTNFGKFKISDLELSEQSKQKWDSKKFQIKTRIKIDSETKTVSKHFLVDLELAFLDTMCLEADVFLGFFKTNNECVQAVEFLEDAVSLVPGIGAFRSRGFGRGDIKFDLEQEETPIIDPLSISINNDFTYIATAYTNFRNKPSGAGELNVVKTKNYISKDQLRGWFVKTWESLYGGDWLSFNDVNNISFPDLFPAHMDGENFLLTTKPAITTLINEEKIIQDMWNKNDKDDIPQENYIRSKTKALGTDNFVTIDGNSVVSIERHARIRNKLNEEFLTESDSLFVQELIKKGTSFGGKIFINTANKEFYQKAIHIFYNINPVINGNVLIPSIQQTTKEKYTIDENAPNINENPPGLVSNAIPLSFELLQHNNSIVLKTEVRHSTVLNRPKRNRVVVAPGSLIGKENLNKLDKYCIAWPGFGKALELIDAEIEDVKRQKSSEQPIQFDKNTIIKNIKNYIISKSQAGVLRNLLNKNNPSAVVKEILENIVEKLEKSERTKEKKVMETLLDELKDKNIKSMRGLLSAYLEALGVERWNMVNKK